MGHYETVCDVCFAVIENTAFSHRDTAGASCSHKRCPWKRTDIGSAADNRPDTEMAKAIEDLLQKPSRSEKLLKDVGKKLPRKSASLSKLSKAVAREFNESRKLKAGKSKRASRRRG